MTDEDLQEMISAGRMTAVVAANDGVFKNNAKAMTLTSALNTAIAAMNASGAAAISAMGLQKDGTQDKNAASAALEKLVRKIAGNAKVIKKDEPAFENVFKIPKGSFSNQVLLETAQAFMNDLTPAAVAKFGEFGFTSVTPAVLQAKIDAVLAGSAQQNTGRGGGIAATAEEKAVIRQLKEDRRTLKTIGTNLCEETGDAGLIAEWKAACKVEKPKPASEPAPLSPPNS